MRIKESNHFTFLWCNQSTGRLGSGQIVIIVQCHDQPKIGSLVACLVDPLQKNLQGPDGDQYITEKWCDYLAIQCIDAHVIRVC